MNFVDEKTLISQAEYAKKLRLVLPPEAFQPNPRKLIILFINLAILVLGWAIASNLDQWNPYLLWLYLPLTLIMGNSVIALLFSSHELMHGTVIRNSRLIYIISLLGLAVWWMPPTLWKAVHNREHHNHTNSLSDPDRNYLSEQPNTWGKWIQNAFVPSSEVNPLVLILGMATAWGVHGFRNLTSVLLFNNKSVDYVPAAFTVSPKERWAILREFIIIAGLHLTVIAYLEFNPLKLALSYFLPISLGYAGGIFYIFTNHLLCPMTSINDPLINSVSLRVHKVFDLLHFNFSNHTAHHVFPGMNSDYYPLVQELLEVHYPGRMNLLDAGECWDLLMQTPRHYKNENTFTDWSGEKSVSCLLSEKNLINS